MRSDRFRRGYVLLTVLAASVVVITALSSLAQASLGRGLRAADAERDLQRRWGILTLNKAVLERTPKVFERREELAATLESDEPQPPVIRDAVRLGNLTFDLLLGDEDAKLNLNVLYHSAGPAKAEQVLMQLNPSVARAVRLVPAVKPAELSREQSLLSRADTEVEGPDTADAFRSWGEVFALAEFEAQIGGDAALPIATTGITCWGGGQLNFRRATDDAILAVAGTFVQDGTARRILQRYRENPRIDLTTLLRTEVSSGPDRERLARRFGKISNNFSLWIHASQPDGRSQLQLTVMRRDDEGVTRYQRFLH